MGLAVGTERAPAIGDVLRLRQPCCLEVLAGERRDIPNLLRCGARANTPSETSSGGSRTLHPLGDRPAVSGTTCTWPSVPQRASGSMGLLAISRPGRRSAEELG